MSNWNPASGFTAYMQQVATAGRRGMAVKLFNVSACAGNWMYDSRCKLDLDSNALVTLIRKWVPRYKRAQQPAQQKHTQHHHRKKTANVTVKQEQPAVSVRGFFDSLTRYLG